MRKNNLFIMFIIIEVCLLLNLILIPKQFVIYIFTGLFIYLIYKKFAEDIKRFIYYSTLLFSMQYLTLAMPLGSKYSIYYFYVSLFIYMIIYLINFWKIRDKFFRIDNFKNKYTIFFFTFAAYAIFSVLLAAHKFSAIKQVIVYAIMFCFMIMIVNENKNRENLKKSFKLLSYIYSGILLLGTLELFKLKYGLRTHFIDNKISFYTFPYAKRIPTVFFYNPNNYAVFLVLAMSIIFVYYLTTNDFKHKRNLLVVYFFSQINLIFTTCRTAWISIFFIFIFAYIILLFTKEKKLRLTTLKFAVGTFLIFLLPSFIPFMAPYYGKFALILILLREHIVVDPGAVAQPLFKIGEGGSVNERVTILYDVVKGVFFKGHILGFGAGNTLDYVESLKNTKAINIHSLLFEMLGDFGLPMTIFAVGIYFSMIFDLLKKAIKNGFTNNKFAVMLALALFGFIFLSFAPSTVITFLPMWLMLGLAGSLVIKK
jgi:teichuronic acid biosynthesis protein TuaE